MTKIEDKILGLTLKEALADEGLWFDGNYLYFRQLKLGKLPIYTHGQRFSKVIGESGIFDKDKESDISKEKKDKGDYNYYNQQDY